MKKRKGIILAGGTGSRLMPMTGLLSKQVLPVYDKPMIYYPLSVLMLARISEILVISSPEHLPQLRETVLRLGNLGIEFKFISQPRPEGIAQALILGEDFLDGSPCALILGDNIFFGHGFSETLQNADENRSSAQIFVHQVNKPEQYGVIELNSDGKIIGIVEKPSVPRSNLAVTGLYFFDPSASQLARQLKPSQRGELEITDLNLLYLKNNNLFFHELGRGVAWFDAGTPSSLLDAAMYVSAIETRQQTKIAAPEEIALTNQWITVDQFLSLPNLAWDNEYSKYLRNLLELRK